MSAEMQIHRFSPDEYVTGTSIMPQKRNPDVFELIKRETNLLQTLPQQVLMLTSNLPSGYNPRFTASQAVGCRCIFNIEECISILYIMLDNIKVKKNITSNPLYNNISVRKK
jgi:argininosuccinate lyase